MAYRIKTVSELTGIPKNTIIVWERRYGVVNPKRADNGYRLYSDKDVALLSQLKRRVEEGLKISEAVDLVTGSEVIAEPSASPSSSSDERFAEIREELERAMMAFDRAAAEDVITRLLNVPYDDLLHRLYFPLLRDIGAGWQRGEVSVAQEHFASSIVRDQLVAMLLRVGCGPEGGDHVVCLTFPGERHEIAVLALAVSLAMSGKRVTYLGTDLPAGELCSFLTEHRPAWVFVSIINPVAPAELEKYASRLRCCASEETRIVLGGAGVQADRPVEGVEIYADWRSLPLLRGDPTLS